MPSTNHIQTGIDSGARFELRKEALDQLIRRITTSPFDTQAALLPFTPSADPDQKRVLETRATTVRIVAPAGSGKTQTLINRAIGRVRDGIKPDRILLLTFDRSAADSLREKLRQQMTALMLQSGTAGAIDRLSILTLNAWGYGLLREMFPAEHGPLAQPFRVQRQFRHDQNSLRQHEPLLHAALPANLRPGFFLELFSLLKNRLFDPRDLDVQDAGEFVLNLSQASVLFPDPLNGELVRHAIEGVLNLFQAYDRGLRQDGVLDFDDQKLRAYRALTASHTTLDTVQRRYDEVIVDEFQDINYLDFALVTLLSARASLVVTGDDDQAIYGFRGCSPDFIIDLEQHLGRSVKSFELRRNYRCPPNIVGHADRLIRHNTRRIIKDPVPHRTDPSEIKIAATQSASVEAKAVVAFIRRVLEGNRTLGNKDVAVLYRTNAQSLPLQIEFILGDIPYHVRGEDNILQNEVLERLLGVLRLWISESLRDPSSVDDQTLAVEAYFTYVDSWRSGQIRSVLARGGRFQDTIRSPEFLEALPKASSSRFAEAVDAALSAENLLDVLDVLRKKWPGMKRGMVGSLEDVVTQKAPLAEIVEIAADFKGDIVDFVETLDRALRQARQIGAGKDESGVSLLTYFRSKGRQWHTVVLTSCNEGIIPHRMAPVEEERRLFYVGMTRASSNLLISYLSDACGQRVKPSRFLEEAGLLDGIPVAITPSTIPSMPSANGRPWYLPSGSDEAKKPIDTVSTPENSSRRPWYERQKRNL